MHHEINFHTIELLYVNVDIFKINLVKLYVVRLQTNFIRRVKKNGGSIQHKSISNTCPKIVQDHFLHHEGPKTLIQ